MLVWLMLVVEKIVKGPLTDPLTLLRKIYSLVVQHLFICFNFYMTSNSSDDVIRPCPWLCN